MYGIVYEKRTFFAKRSEMVGRTHESRCVAYRRSFAAVAARALLETEDLSGPQLFPKRPASTRLRALLETRTVLRGPRFPKRPTMPAVARANNYLLGFYAYVLTKWKESAKAYNKTAHLAGRLCPSLRKATAKMSDQRTPLRSVHLLDAVAFRLVIRQAFLRRHSHRIKRMGSRQWIRLPPNVWVGFAGRVPRRIRGAPHRGSACPERNVKSARCQCRAPRHLELRPALLRWTLREFATGGCPKTAPTHAPPAASRRSCILHPRSLRKRPLCLKSGARFPVWAV